MRVLCLIGRAAAVPVTTQPALAAPGSSALTVDFLPDGNWLWLQLLVAAGIGALFLITRSGDNGGGGWDDDGDGGDGD